MISRTAGTCLRAAMLGALLLRPGWTAPAAAEQVDLSPTLNEGHEWRYRYSVESTMRLTMLGENHELSMAQEVNIRLKVVAKHEDGSAEVELVHERIRLGVSGEHPGSFDSTKPGRFDDDNIYARLLAPLVDAPLTLDVDENGAIRSVRGLDTLRPDDPLEARLFQSLFGEDEIIRMYAPIFSLKSDDPNAETGESWKITQRRSSGLGIIESALRLRLTRATRRDAIIRIGGAEEFKAPAGNAAVTEQSSVTGQAIWDLSEGSLRDLTTESVTVFSPDPDGTMGVEISGKAEASTVLRRLESSGP